MDLSVIVDLHKQCQSIATIEHVTNIPCIKSIFTPPPLYPSKRASISICSRLTEHSLEEMLGIGLLGRHIHLDVILL